MDPSSGVAGYGKFASELILRDLMVGERGFEPPTPWSRTGFDGFLVSIEIWCFLTRFD